MDEFALKAAHGYYRKGDYKEASRWYDLVIQDRDASFDAYHGAALCKRELKQHDGALPLFDKAAEMGLMEFASALINKASALAEIGGRTEEAVQIMENVVRLCPRSAGAYYARGLVYMQQERMEEAIADFDRSLALDPDMQAGDAIYAKGFASLVLGDYTRGFEWFENRDKGDVIFNAANGVEWTGVEDLRGKHILVGSEMGRGDTIQFGRFLQLLQERGARVSCVIHHPECRSLFNNIFNVSFYGVEDEWPVTDYWVRLMSLARCFRVTTETVPPPLVLPIKTKTWQGRPLRIGLCWAGNTASRYDEHRTIPLRALEPLVILQERGVVQLFALQKELREGDAELMAQWGIEPLGEKMTDFLETAKIMAWDLDLIITCDTALGHLAGTVGIPTRLLLTKFRTYWMWLRGLNTNPWYSSMRCVKQTVDGDWSGVIEQVVEELRGHFAPDSAARQAA